MILFFLFLVFFPSLVFAQNPIVTPGTATAKSARPVACVNPTTFALESCGGGGAGGGLTDAELRATPVPISGTVTATGPLTDAQLRATPVPVSGTVTATGPLTDAQLRATPVPVSGPLTVSELQASIGSTAIFNGQQAVTASAVALPSNSSKEVCVKAMLANTINVYVGTSGVTITTGLELAPGDAYCVTIDNSSDLLVIASTTGASVSFAGRN